MPSTAEAIDHFQSSKCVFLPGKAANAGGVAGSGFEMTQNSQRLYWTEVCRLFCKKIHFIRASLMKS